MGYLTVQQTKALLVEIEKKIDTRNARRFFKHLARKDEIKDLHVPLINMPKTLPTLITIGFASSSDSTADSDSFSTNNSNRKEWSQVLDEDGRLRYDQILSLFPPSRDDDFTKREKNQYCQSLEFAHFALSSYKDTHGVEYELVAPMLSLVFVTKAPLDDLAHVNFLAKPKNSDSSPDLFFAEVVACGVSIHQVNKCCILTPRPSPSPVAVTSDSVYIWHPPGEKDCEPCS